MTSANRYWGFWATSGFSLLVIAVFVIVQTIALVVFGLYKKGWDYSALSQSYLARLAFDGDAISYAEIPSAFLSIALIALFIYIRKTGNIRDYLQLYLPKPLSLLKWLGIMLLTIISLEVLNNIIGRETPKFMTDVYGSTKNMPLLWIAIVIAAPLFEEFLFRGFLFEGLRHSIIGVTGTIIISSAAWAAMHIQYEWFEISMIFIFGILFSIAKLKTNSLFIPISMHMLMNLLASVLMALSSEEAATLSPAMLNSM
jgi:membrane protease YdiL (CAAX protease family)